MQVTGEPCIFITLKGVPSFHVYCFFLAITLLQAYWPR